MKKFILSICVLFFNVPPAFALDTYDPDSATLSVANLVFGANEYLSVKAKLGPVTVLSIGSPESGSSIAETFRVPPPIQSIDSFDAGTNILAIPDLIIGSTKYKNLRVRLGSVNVTSVGGNVPYFEPPPSPSP